MIEVCIEGRVSKLTWSEFARVMACTGLTHCIEILEIQEGGVYVAA